MLDSRNRSVGRITVTRAAQRVAGARRRGQALLMAVLLMIFAALLGSTFITVVALNLNHAGRQQDMSSADTATRAGLLVTNQNLTTSEAGENWRPEMINPPPGTDKVAEYTTYYTPLERAQGWARSSTSASPMDNDSTAGVVGGNWDPSIPTMPYDYIREDWAKLNYLKEHNGDRVFVKFPDPRQQPSSTSTPIYLVEVKFLDPNIPASMTGESQDKAGKIRITVIGEANDNTNVFTRRVSYKSTSVAGGPMAYSYYVSNWDSTNNRLISTSLTNSPTNNPVTINANNSLTPTTTITVQNPAGITRGRLLIVHDPNGVTPDTVVAVQSVSSAGVTVLSTVSTSRTFNVGALVQAASPIMQNLLGSNDSTGTKMFDAAGSGTPGRQSYDSTDSTLDAFNVTNSSAVAPGIFFNASAVAQQKALFALNSTGSTPSLLQAAGLIYSSPEQQATDNGGAAQPLASSPAVKSNPNPQSTDLGANPVKPISPPRIDGQRYLQLTKYSDVANGSAYGYGSVANPTGIYIDNANDFEKVATTTGYRALSIAETHRLWQRKSFPAVPSPGNTSPNPDANPNVPIGTSAGNVTIPAGPDAYKRYRLAYANHAVVAPGQQDGYTYPSATGSLEERGLRGWVSPYEFKPRGVLIEFNAANNTITITRDQISDAFPTTADPTQAWKDPTGAPLVGAYQMVINLTSGQRKVIDSTGATVYTCTTPFNGVIYAEGNVRIHGTLGTRSVTVVSMGNIYIDGDLEQGVDASGKPTYIGTFAKKGVTLNPTQFFVHSVNPSAIPGATPAPLRAGDDQALFPNANDRTPEWFYNVDKKAVQLARNIHFDVTPVNVDPMDQPVNNLYLAVRHSGQQRRAFTLTYNDPSTTGGDFTVAAKDPKTDTTIDSTEKLFTAKPALGVTDTSPAHSFTEDLLSFGAAGNVRGDDGTHTIANLQSETPFLTTTNGSGVPQPGPWTIDATDATGVNMSALPARRMAQFNPATGLSWTSGQTQSVMLTTSVGAFWNPGKSDTTNLALTQPPHEVITVSDGGFTIGSSFKYVTASPPIPYSDNNQQYFEDLGGSQVSPTPAPAAPQLPVSQSSVNESFYWNRVGQTQARMRWSSYRLDDGGTKPAQVGDNLIVFSRDQNEANDALLPAYRVGGFKLEHGLARNAPWSATGNFATNAEGNPNNEQAIQIKVQATVFAQEGSWFVIPVPLSPLVDLTGAGNAAPTDAVSRAAATHYRRPNYQVYIQGNIAQNYAPTGENDIDVEQDPDGHTSGAMAAWIDSMAYPGDLDLITPGDLNTVVGQHWRSIAYLANPLPPNSGLYMPVSPDIDLTG